MMNRRKALGLIAATPVAASRATLDPNLLPPIRNGIPARYLGAEDARDACASEAISIDALHKDFWSRRSRRQREEDAYHVAVSRLDADIASMRSLSADAKVRLMYERVLARQEAANWERILETYNIPFEPMRRLFT